MNLDKYADILKAGPVGWSARVSADQVPLLIVQKGVVPLGTVFTFAAALVQESKHQQVEVEIAVELEDGAMVRFKAFQN